MCLGEPTIKSQKEFIHSLGRRAVIVEGRLGFGEGCDVVPLLRTLAHRSRKQIRSALLHPSDMPAAPRMWVGVLSDKVRRDPTCSIGECRDPMGSMGSMGSMGEP